jgi:multiple sugar transport system substrate-binding protein
MKGRWLRLLLWLSALLAAVGLAACGSGSGAAVGSGANGSARVTVRWYVGLGAGDAPAQISLEQAIVAKFNASHKGVVLKLEVVDNAVAFNTLQQEIASGNAPDIVGPIGTDGAAAFEGQFLDLNPYIKKTGFGLAVYAPEQIAMLREADDKLTGLPLGVYPSFIYYNKTLFQRAGLPYPPHTFGGRYDGRPWTIGELSHLALLLTLDRNGNNATSPRFDPAHIVQWGFELQDTEDARAQGTLFAPGTFVAKDGAAQIPANWLKEWRWYYDLVWKAHAAPDQLEINSRLLDADNGFHTGNVAMAFTHLWYASSLEDSAGQGDDFFDIAVVPSYDGRSTAELDADSFRILATTKHPAAAFTALSYLVSSAALPLCESYDAMPARPDLRAPFFASLDATFPQRVDWSVVERSLSHQDIPSCEVWMPNDLRAEDCITTFSNLLLTDPRLDVARQAARLHADLNRIFRAAPSSAPGS